MRDPLGDTPPGDSTGRADGRERSEDDGQMFQCPRCGARRVASTIPYDALGYAVCPVCSYVDGP